MTETCANCKKKFPEIDMIYDAPNDKYFHNQACADEHWLRLAKACRNKEF